MHWLPMVNHGKKAIFLDRDGVINTVVHRDPPVVVQGKESHFTAPHYHHEFKIIPGVADALGALGALGFLRVLVTNQPDISYGLMPPEEHELMLADLRALPLDDIYVCYHRRDEGCACKKPKPGMLLAAAEKWGIDLPNSYIIGDREQDMAAGRAAGCKTILVMYDYNRDVPADLRAGDLQNAAAQLKQYENIH